MKRRQPTRRAAKWVGILVAVVAVWVLSVLVEVTYYGEVFALTFQAGFVGVYWGDRGGTDIRNSWVYNHWAEPWRGGGVGRGWPGSPVWDIYGPVSVWYPVGLDREYVRHQLGLWKPRIVVNSTRHAYEPQSVVLPIWMLIVSAATFAIIAWRRDRAIPGYCQQCGYKLTGNVSGVCPECGQAVEAAE